MTNTTNNRPLAIVMAFAVMASFWLPTISTPAKAASAEPVHITIIAGQTQPVVM
ncbi:hypothetical protein [Novosphingobium sp. PC22D]|uniref:hypothetical protein n=1 Tax=Novosphingobium sp. PC22D TaxID=1962403 RepID=UPI0014398CC3|nr:hypothetical protein [Novosphingobium sp. PC22D]